MGLAERRQIASADAGLEEALAELRAHLGFDIEMEVDKSSFPEDKTVMDCYEYYKDYSFPMVAKVLTQVARDDMGKEAVKESIRKVVIINTATDKDNGGAKEMTLHDGVLTVKQGWYGYSDILFGEQELLQQVESAL